MKQIHKTVDSGSARLDVILKAAKELIEQPCDGNKRDTLKNYQTHGLFYTKKDDSELKL
ncbi:hypothetical protein D3C73_1538640 [compost metagenome]